MQNPIFQYQISVLEFWLKQSRCLDVQTVVAPEIFFVGGIEGQNALLRGQIQKFAQNGWFWPFFLLTGGQVEGAEPPTGGAGKCPHAPLMLPLCIDQFCIVQLSILCKLNYGYHNQVIFINIFQLEYFSTVKFAMRNEKKATCLVIPKSPKVWKKCWKIRLGSF